MLQCENITVSPYTVVFAVCKGTVLVFRTFDHPYSLEGFFALVYIPIRDTRSMVHEMHVTDMWEMFSGTLSPVPSPTLDDGHHGESPL